MARSKRKSGMPVAEELAELDIDEQKQKDAEAYAERQKILEALAMELAKTRSDAIAARNQSGIEEEWNEDEEFYEGIDDRNRGEHKAWRTKPMGQIGTQVEGDQDNGSTIFFNITRPYVDMAASRVGDMLLPTDDRGWSIKPTPVPELAEMVKGNMPRRLRKQIEQAPEFQGLPEDQRGEAIQKTVDDAVQQEKDLHKEASERATRAQDRIDDWQVESGYTSQMRLVIKSAAKIGTGVLKGPIPTIRSQIAYKGGKLIKQDVLKPESRWIDAWNLFPEAGCGQSIHNGSHIWERDDISSRTLYELLNDDSYLSDQIDMALREGPQRATKEFQEGAGGRAGMVGLTQSDMKNMYEIWYYHGQLTREQLEIAGCDCDEYEDSYEGDEGGAQKKVTRLKPKTERYNCVMTMVNNRVIKAALNPLETGEFPYDVMVWQERMGHWTGIGVARQIRPPQRMIVAAARNMMDNLGMSAGPMWIYKQGLVEPLDGYPEIAPRKGWMMGEDDNIDDVSKAFTFIEMPSRQEELQALIMLGLKMAEDVTGMPMIMQGQMGQSAPDTLGGMEMLQNNAGAPLRRIAKLFDDNITEPHTKRYYAYLMQDPDVPDEEKGDFMIDAHGSSALVERDLANQAIAQMATVVVNPIFGLDPKKWMIQHLKSQRLDPALFEYDDDEWKQVVEQLQQPPADSSLQVAQIRAQSAEKIAADKNQMAIATEGMKLEAEDKHLQMEIANKSVDQALEQMKLQGVSQQVIDKIKGDLAKETMRLNTQVQLAGQQHAHEAAQVATEGTEPPGKAPTGEAFQK